MFKYQPVYVRAYVRRQLCKNNPSFDRLERRGLRKQTQVSRRFVKNVLKADKSVVKWKADVLLEKWFGVEW